MICPECSSVIIVQAPDAVIWQGSEEVRVYYHDCQRCYASIEITVRVKRKGDPDYVKKYKEWLNEGRTAE